MFGNTTTGMTLPPQTIERFATSANTDYLLPSTGVRAGRVFWIINRSISTAFQLTVKSSDGSIIDSIYSGRVVVMALQDNPTLPAHWDKVEVFDQQISSVTVADGAGWSQLIPIIATRLGSSVTLNINPSTAATSTSTLDPRSNTGAIAASFRPSTFRLFQYVVYNNATYTDGSVEVDNVGRFRFKANRGGTGDIFTASGQKGFLHMLSLSYTTV